MNRASCRRPGIPPRCGSVHHAERLSLHGKRGGEHGLGSKRGARLIVIDPRRAGVATKAHLWIRPRPGTDAALALGIAHQMITRGWSDRGFVRDWTNGPMLVRTDTGAVLTARDLGPEGDARQTMAWDLIAGCPVAWDRPGLSGVKGSEKPGAAHHR
jgi:anaerobic selenocysteine-containing dehydrogenase